MGLRRSAGRDQRPFGFFARFVDWRRRRATSVRAPSARALDPLNDPQRFCAGPWAETRGAGDGSRRSAATSTPATKKTPFEIWARVQTLSLSTVRGLSQAVASVEVAAPKACVSVIAISGMALVPFSGNDAWPCGPFI